MSKDDKPTPHDQNFKNLILDYPFEAIAFYAPEEAKRLDFKQLKNIPVRQEMLKKKLGDRYRELDTPVLLQHRDGRREGLIFAFEEESQTRFFSIHRLAHYCLDLSELFKLDSIVPVVIFLQKSSHAKKELLLGTNDNTYLGFRYLYCALADLDYRDWQESNNRVAILNLPCMQYEKSQKLAMYYQTTKRYFQLEHNRNQLEKYIDFIDYYAKLSEQEFNEFTERYPKEGKAMLTFSQRYTQKGIVQGMEQGVIQGMQQGMQQGQLLISRQTLQRQLKRRFKKIPENYLKKIEQAELSELERWLDNILDAESLEKVFV